MLDDGSNKRLPLTDMSDKTALGAAGAVWSTVLDLMRWVKAIFVATHNEAEQTSSNTLKQTTTILCSIISIADSVNEN